MKKESSPTGAHVRDRLLTLSVFHRQLHYEISRAEAHGGELTVVVFQLPVLPRGPERQEVERALYHGVRRGNWLSRLRGLTAGSGRPRRRTAAPRSDFSARLSERLVAVALPCTGSASGAAAERLARLLFRVARGPVGSGIACYPADGRTSTELITAAVRRCQTAGPLMSAMPVSDHGLCSAPSPSNREALAAVTGPTPTSGGE